MSPDRRRHVLLASLVAVCGLNVACATHPYYHWQKDASLPVCTSYVWKQEPKASMPGLCMKNGVAATEATSCAIGCLILSPFSEIEAEWVYDRDGTPIREHEIRHTQGWSHQ